MKKLHYLYADFETTKVDIDLNKWKSVNDYYRNSKSPVYPQVYSWCMLWNKNVKTGIKPNTFKDNTAGVYGIEKKNSFSEFLKQIETITVDSIMFFNNLRKFDGHFLLPMMDESGYTYIPPFEIDDIDDLPSDTQSLFKKRFLKIKNSLLKNSKTIREKYNTYKDMNEVDKAKKYLYKQIERNWKLLLPKEYSVMTDGNGNIYEIKIGLGSSKRTKGNKKNRALIIRDNLFLFPSSIANMGKTLNEVWDISYEKGLLSKEEYESKKNSFSKLESKYDRATLYNSLKEFEEDGNEKDYLIQDVYILLKFHEMIERFIPRSKWKMTIGSTTYKEWESDTGGKLVNDQIAKGNVGIKTLKRGVKRYIYCGKEYTTENLKRRLLKQILPTKWMEELYSDDSDETCYEVLYKYFTGGLTFVNEKFRGQYLENITFIDRNSHYPSEQVSDAYVPVGKGVKGNHKDYPFKFYKITINKDITNVKGLPFLYDDKADKREYLTTLKRGMVVRFTSITMSRFLKYYNPPKGSYKTEVEFSFRQTKISKLFGEYIRKWYEKKSNAINPTMKFIAKLFLNNNWGKLAMKIFRDYKVWSPSEQIWYDCEKMTSSNYYLPLGIVVPELGRMSLVDSVGENYETCAYGDTDSIVMIDFNPKNHPNIEIHPTKIGCWDYEIKGSGLFRRPKQYLVKNESKTKIAYSGLNLDRLELEGSKDEKFLKKHIEKITFEDMVIGKSINNQLTSNRLPSKGVLISQNEKDIKPIWNKDYKPLTEQKFITYEDYLPSLQKIRKLSKKN